MPPFAIANPLIARMIKCGRFPLMVNQKRSNNLFRLSLIKQFSSLQPIRELQFNTLVEMQQQATLAYSNNPMFGTKKGPAYDWITYKDFDKEVQKCRNVLTHLKVGMDDKVALISNNRVEWAILKYAAVGLGAQIVPMYEAQMEKEWQYILNDSDSKLLVVATESIYAKTKDYGGKVGKVESVICLDAGESDKNSFAGWMAKVANEPAVPALGPDVITPDRICTIIYTSGTTGNPKGVELTHQNIVSDVHGANGLWRRQGELEQQVTLAFLPWAHVFGLTCEMHTLTATGSARAIVPHRDMILECLQLARPTTILSVPALFNRIYDGVMKNVAEQSSLKQKLFHYAISVSRDRNHRLEYGKPVSAWLALKHRLADKIVLSKIRAKLGGRLKNFAAGGAATGLTVLQFFEDIGVPIMEGYGLTETSPMITIGTISWELRRLGTVGVPLIGCEIRIIDPNTLEERPYDTDGEVTCTGPMVMKGYRNNPKANAEVFYYHDGKRYFRTGDLGQMVEGKFLKITGRIKEQFKLENGKYVVPAPLEDACCRSPFISQMLLYGENKPHPVALIVPSMPDIAAWYEKQKLQLGAAAAVMTIPTATELADTSKTTVELFNQPAFQQLITSELIRMGAALKTYERPTVWLPVLHPFSQENQQLTPKMSLRRAGILSVYKTDIDSMYSGDAGNKVIYPKGIEKDDE